MPGCHSSSVKNTIIVPVKSGKKTFRFYNTNREQHHLNSSFWQESDSISMDTVPGKLHIPVQCQISQRYIQKRRQAKFTGHLWKIWFQAGCPKVIQVDGGTVGIRTCHNNSFLWIPSNMPLTCILLNPLILSFFIVCWIPVFPPATGLPSLQS